MPAVTKKKVFYQIDEACSLLGLSLLDMAVLASERKLQFCATVGKVLVEDGHYEVALDDTLMPIPTDQRYVEGLVDLRPEDAWYVLRAGSQMIFRLPAEDGCYRRLVGTGEDDRGYTVIRDELGVRHEELRRYAALEEGLDDIAPRAKGSGRGSQPHYDWEAAWIEAFRRIYFDGVPESYGALVRHIQAWFATKGSKVPDESTVKRRLRVIWTTFGSERDEEAAQS